jgi:hypothetical protein
MRELPEAAIRIIEFICLCMAARKERLVEPYSAPGLGGAELMDLGGELLKLGHKGETFAVANEYSRSERYLDFTLHWVCLAANPSFHLSLFPNQDCSRRHPVSVLVLFRSALSL